MYTSDGELYFSDYEKAEIEICLFFIFSVV